MYSSILIQTGFVLILTVLKFNTADPEQVHNQVNKGPWTLVWSDEFDYNGLPDITRWNYDVGGHGWGNNEKQYYLEKSAENAYVKEGRLHITALKKKFGDNNYTSAKLTTYQRFTLQYGKIEVSARIPAGLGTWPAIWMLPVSIKENTERWPLCGEIDIMEHVGKNQDFIHTSLHSELYNHMKGTQITHSGQIKGVSETFHKYAVEWTNEYISFFIDDKLFFESRKGQDGRVSANEGWPFDKHYFLILNLAIGGNWGGPVDDAIFPVSMEVDYVRIYKRN